MTNRTGAKLLAAALSTAAGPAALADTIYKGAPGTNALALPGVHVSGAANGALSYTTDTGSTRTVPLTDVQRLTLDGQANFNAAEDAYAAGDDPTALTRYTTVLASGGGPAYLRARAAQRLAAVGRQQHRYDAQVTAYAGLVNLDPPAAAAVRPAAPKPNDPTLTAAQAAVTRALSSASDNDQRAALLGVNWTSPGPTTTARPSRKRSSSWSPPAAPRRPFRPRSS